jgi:methylthioribulose-1-phosphate dehydratase
MFSKENNQLAQELLEVISFFSKKGWSPATSSNYSVRSNNPSEFIISRSGVDKSRFRESDFIMIDERGNILPPFDRPSIKSSAETQIHTALYVENPDINCVLHTHSVLGTVLSQSLEKEKKLIFEGLEILKGLEGNSSHELIEVLPIVSNSQDMSVILRD